MKITKRTLKKIIKEQVELQKTLPEIMEIMENNYALQELSNMINNILGFKPKLEMKLQSNTINIFSNENLLKYTGKLGKALFKKIEFDFWGGGLTKDNQVWFSPHVSYEHLDGGRNGINVIWNTIVYDWENNKWLTGRKFV